VDWRQDILQTYRIAQRRLKPLRFPLEFESLVTSLHAVVDLPKDRAAELAGLLFWRGSERVNGLLTELMDNQLANFDEIEVPWSSLRLILTRMLAEGVEGISRAVESAAWGKLTWERFGLEVTGRSARVVEGVPNLNVLSGESVHAYTTELRIPVVVSRLSPATRRLFERCDLIDFPGSQRPYVMYREETLGTPNARVAMIERGRIDFSFRSQGARHPLDVLVFLQKYGAPADAVTVSDLLGQWFEFRQGPSGARRQGLPSCFFSGVSFFDKVLNVFRKSGASDIEKFFVEGWLSNLPEEVRTGVGFGNPVENLHWLAMGDDLPNLRPDELAELRRGYEEATAIRGWIEDPLAKWDAALKEDNRGVQSILRRICDQDFGASNAQLYHDHLVTRLRDIAGFFKLHLPASDASVQASMRADQTRELTMGLLNSNRPEEELLKNYVKLRHAFEVPVRRMSVPPGTDVKEGPRLWYRDLVSNWAVKANESLARLDRSNGERWGQVVGWLRQSLRRAELEDRFAAAVGIVPRRQNIRGGDVDVFPRFAATLVSDVFYDAGSAGASRRSVPQIFDSSQIDWLNRIEREFVETLVDHGRPKLAGDEDGLAILKVLTQLIGEQDAANNGGE